MIADIARKLRSKSVIYIEKFTASTNWLFKLCVLCFVLSLFSAFPSYDVYWRGVEFKSSWDAFYRQIENPLKYYNYDSNSHEAKMAFRIFVPLLAHALNLNAASVFFLQYISLILFFFLTGLLIWKITADKVSTFILTLSCSFIFTGNVLVSDLRAIFDGVAFTLLCLAMCSKQSLIIFLAVFFAGFTDERALISSSLIYLWFSITEQELFSVTLKSFFNFNYKNLVIIWAWIAYFTCRYLLISLFDFKTQAGGTTFFREQINNLPIGIASSLEGFWIVVLISLVYLLYKKRWLLSAVYIGLMSMIIFVAMSVIDITRSMAYITPAIFISLYIISKVESVCAIRNISFVVLIICLFPTYYVEGKDRVQLFYPLPLQIIRVITS
jgi:hypothetical protein